MNKFVLCLFILCNDIALKWERNVVYISVTVDLVDTCLVVRSAHPTNLLYFGSKIIVGVKIN